MKSISFIGEPQLDLVKMEEVKGGLSLNSYAGGCNSHEHQLDLPVIVPDQTEELTIH